MFNQITLEFKAKSLEEEYRQSTSMQIKNEYLFLFIFLEVISFFIHQKKKKQIVLIFFLSESIYSQDNLLILYYASMTICVLISLLMILKNPKLIEYILPVLQILIGINFRIILSKGFQSTYQAFFYGGLSQYLHIAIFFQGHKIIIQTLILFPLIFIYMNPDSNTNQIISNIQLVFGLIGSIILKYIFERNRRFQFLDHRENKKWLDLLENCFNNLIMVVSYNQSRNRIEILKANNQVFELLGASNNDQLRQSLREVYVNHALESSRNLIDNLEEFLIKQLKDNSKQNEIQQIKVKHSPSQRKFMIKIFQNYTHGEQLLVLKLIKINSFNNSKDMNVQLLNKTILIKELAYNLQCSYFQNISMDSNINLSKLVQTLMLTLVQFPAYMSKIIQTYDIFVLQFQKDLRKLLTRKYKNLQFIGSDQDLTINTSESALLFIIVSILDLFGQKEENYINCELIVNDNIDFQFQVFQISNTTISKIRLINQNNIYISNSCGILQIQAQMWDYFHYVCSLRQYMRVPAIEVIQLVVLKFLLLFFTTDGKLHLAKDKNSLIYYFSIIKQKEEQEGWDQLIQHIEQEYSQKQYQSIKQEFLVFFLFAQYAIIITAINDLQMGEYEIAITEIVALFLHFFIFMVVIKIPVSVKYILPIMQIICSLLFSNSVQTMSENQYSLYQVFYYGGIALFFHFAMLFQGVTIILQSLALVVVVSIYLTLNQNSNLSQFLDYLTYSGIFIGMIIIKYIFEKNKRLQFIENRENQKWLNIMENSMKNYIIILQYKKKQDHLEIVRYNDQVKQHFSATKNENIKWLLKDLIVISDKDNQKISLEQYIIQHQKQSHKTQEIQDIDVKYTNKAKFGVRVINNFINLEQLIILKLTPHIKKDQRNQQNTFLLTNIELLKDLSSQLLTLLYNHQKMTRLIYSKIVQITMIHIVFDNKNYELCTNNKTINMLQYLMQLQKQIKIVYDINMNINPIIHKFFNTSKCSFQLILVTLIEILKPSAKSMLIDVKQLNINILKLEFICEIIDAQKLKLLDIINNKDPYFDKSISVLSQQQSIWDYYSFLKENSKFSYNSSLLLQMVVLKVLLLQFSSDGLLRINKSGTQTIFSIELIEQNQAFPQLEFNLLNSPKVKSVSALLASL